MSKPARSISEQLQLLASRGLPVSESERVRLVRLLMSHNYYRLSGYWRYFQRAPQAGDDSFRPDASVDAIERVYSFDRELRRIVGAGLADLEIAFRSRLAYALATLASPSAYLDRDFYSDERGRRGQATVELRDELLAELRRELGRSREDFIAHHLRRDTAVPIWAAVEALSFGTVSKVYRLCGNDDVRWQVAKSFRLDPARTESALRALVVLRNTCAHHGRLWNRLPTIPLQVPRALQVDPDRSIYRQTIWGLIVTLEWLVDGIRSDTSFSVGLRHHLDRHPDLLEGLQQPHRR
ncbi:Abortive infection bacteriophage resistance protein [Curtobacterium sp. 314Chir4.1]|nr:Abortive infection bacteriophage resistance protein [Curtobacterium sp. 314Chir4.1]